jgi:bacteriorhodopsin
MDGGLGWKLWAGIVAGVIGLAIAAFIVFAFFGWAWYSFGFFGMFAILAGLLILFGYVYDKREQRQRSRLAP